MMPAHHCQKRADDAAPPLKRCHLNNRLTSGVAEEAVLAVVPGDDIGLLVWKKG